MSHTGQWLRSLAFTAIMFLTVPIYALLVYVCALAPLRARFVGVHMWVDTILFLLRLFCRLDHRIEGSENIPARNCVVLMKHSSAWETIAQLKMFPAQTWVLKRELLWVPFFGWALKLLDPIAIDRRAGRSAVQQVIEQGRRKLELGFWVMIFPEGTRVPAGQTKRYGLGGALLASAAGCPVLPVAHDAGYYWPRRGLLKRSGTIRVVIGPPIPTGGRDPRAINADVQRFIETTLERLRQQRLPG